MTKILLIGLGGFVGAIARYALSGVVQRRFDVFPAGTLAVNVLGCLAIGGILALVEGRQVLGPETRLFLTIGVLGSFTTFSTFGYETGELLRNGALGLALANVGANVIVGVLAVWAGRTAVLAVLP